MTKTQGVRWQRAAAVAALVAALCSGCVPSSGGEGADTSNLVVQAVEQSLPDASSVLASSNASGFDYGWSVEIDYPVVPLTPDILSDALQAAAAVDADAVSVTLYFFEAGTDNALPIREAADELGLPWTRVGAGASWLTGQLPGRGA